MPERREIQLKPGERIDELQRNGYGIIQNKGAFCFGMDAVLLSGFAEVRRNESAVDLGTGTGIIPILLEAKTEGRAFYGIEIQEAMAEMAERSVQLNGLEDKVHIVRGDLRKICERDRELLAALPFPADVVTSNPPYMKAWHGLANPDDSKAIARHEVCCSLEDVCHAAAVLLRDGGRFYMVHRPQRLPEIIAAMRQQRLEPKRLKMVHPFIDHEANMVLIEAVRGGNPGCRVEKPVIVYKEKGVYTQEIYDIYGY